MGIGEFLVVLFFLLLVFEEFKLLEVFVNERFVDYDENIFVDLKNCSVVLVGLYVCGDFFVIMLRLVFWIILSLVILRLICNK